MHLITVDPARGCWNVFEALRITTHSGSNTAVSSLVSAYYW